MNKTVRFYIIILLLLFAGAIAIEFSTPVPVDWRPTYNEKHTKPYGLKVFREQLPKLAGVDSVTNIKTSAYEFFDDHYQWEDSTYTIKGTFLHIDQYSDIDEYSVHELFNFASNGNAVFISSTYPPIEIRDSLDIRIENNLLLPKKVSLGFANKRLKSDSLTIEKGFGQSYFSKIDTLNTTVLGYQKLGDSLYTNFIKVAYGTGSIFLHLQPAVFTNYHLLKDQHYRYTEAVLSYLPSGAVFFDSRNKPSELKGTSELRFILSKPALRWAWLFGLASLLIFMIFNAKRRQRIVKVVKPLENTTVAFTKTIGNLYYESKDHNNLVEKKITYFLEKLRRTYYVDTQVMDEKFINNLAQKTGKDKDMIGRLVKLIAQLKARRHCNEGDLLRINKMIEKFYRD